MKTTFSYLMYSLILGIVLLFLQSCKEDDSNNNPSGGTVTDIDGNVYRVKDFCGKTWMLENLKVTKYNNMELIDNVTDDIDWANSTTGAFCYYNNAISNSSVYGNLYNWHAVKDNRKIAPEGYHVPTMEEIEMLISCIGDPSGDKLKEMGNSHWMYDPSIAANNESEFTALPGGMRYSAAGTTEFRSLTSSGSWWSKTSFPQGSLNYIWYLDLDYDDQNAALINTIWSEIGFSVRCVKD